MTLEEQICERLAVLSPTHLELIDESALHAGHEGARAGGKHFKLHITSRSFSDLPALARHRLVYHALGALMRKEIHALSVIASAPQENQSNH